MTGYNCLACNVVHPYDVPVVCVKTDDIPWGDTITYRAPHSDACECLECEYLADAERQLVLSLAVRALCYTSSSHQLRGKLHHT